MDNREVDYLMGFSESGVIIHSDANADINNVLEWLDTPRGGVYGRPEWGNELAQFKHEPTESTATAMSIEFNVLRTLTRDLPNIVLTSIYCEPSKEESDFYIIRLGIPSGEIVKTIK
jgi:phage baseplate assembly protein W